MFFFFSSRRRHTRSLCDWSSDVCSSDLAAPDRVELVRRRGNEARARCAERMADRNRAAVGIHMCGIVGEPQVACHEIGRASCRERVESAVDGLEAKRKKEERETGRNESA